VGGERGIVEYRIDGVWLFHGWGIIARGEAWRKDRKIIPSRQINPPGLYSMVTLESADGIAASRGNAARR